MSVIAVTITDARSQHPARNVGYGEAGRRDDGWGLDSDQDEIAGLRLNGSHWHRIQ